MGCGASATVVKYDPTCCFTHDVSFIATKYFCCKVCSVVRRAVSPMIVCLCNDCKGYVCLSHCTSMVVEKGGIGSDKRESPRNCGTHGRADTYRGPDASSARLTIRCATKHQRLAAAEPTTLMDRPSLELRIMRDPWNCRRCGKDWGGGSKYVAAVCPECPSTSPASPLCPSHLLEVYQGQLPDDTNATITFRNGTTYIGNVCQGQLCGRGAFHIAANKSIISGFVVRRSANGGRTNNNSNSELTVWGDTVRSDNGVIQYSRERMKYVGPIRNSAPHNMQFGWRPDQPPPDNAKAPKLLNSADQVVYMGGVNSSGQREGLGVAVNNNDASPQYAGWWYKDRKDGPGVEEDGNGARLAVQHTDGNRTSTMPIREANDVSYDMAWEFFDRASPDESAPLDNICVEFLKNILEPAECLLEWVSSRIPSSDPRYQRVQIYSAALQASIVPVKELSLIVAEPCTSRTFKEAALAATNCVERMKELQFVLWSSP